MPGPRFPARVPVLRRTIYAELAEAERLRDDDPVLAERHYQLAAVACREACEIVRASRRSVVRSGR
jgi:hypothetical protein